MKRTSVFCAFLAAFSVLYGCNSGSGGGGSKTNVQGNYYLQFFEDDTNFGLPWGDAGIYGVDMVQEGSGVTFVGVGLSIAAADALDGDTVTLEYESEYVQVEYLAKFDDAPFQRGEMKFTYLGWECDEQGTPCYSHYVLHGPRVSPNPENPVLEYDSAAFNSVEMDRILLVSHRTRVNERIASQ